MIKSRKELNWFKKTQCMLYFEIKTFSFSSEENANDPCGLSKPLEIVAGLEAGEITSPEYPSNYANSLDCQWLIESFEPPPLNGVKISFTFFDVESG